MKKEGTMWKIKAVLCVLVGHSSICSFFFGYRYCNRCGAQVGDSLGSIDPGAKNAVFICCKDGDDCETCRENRKRLTWKDRLLAGKVEK